MRSKAMKRALAAVMTGILAGGMLAGCGASASKDTATASDSAAAEKTDSAAADSAAEGAVDLSFYIWSDEENYISKVVDQYNSSQDKIHVTLTSIPSDSYDDKLKVLLAGQSDVDIVDIRGMAQATTYAAGGALLDLTDRIANSDLDTSKYGDMWGNSTYNDEYIFCRPEQPAGRFSTMRIW